ncbi:hypothetical protein AB1Y20_010381 [Prymnesium parvum]|uniref:Plastid lipid-associated protein/fibrillin conserved domain-containing protein n=1 Tax=Prymnesium parvum TaxID=97485 RepID=A0AB34IR83_PRYPA
MWCLAGVLAAALIAPPLAPTARPCRPPRAHPSLSALSALEDSLLSCASGKEAIDLFKRLETAAPPPRDLLSSPEAAARLNGRWVLEATVAALDGTDDLALKGVEGAVNASGLVVPTDQSKKPVQQIDVKALRIGNEIELSLPLGIKATLRVAGSFRADARDGRRALVEFDSLDLFTPGGRRLVRAGFVFDVIRRLRPSLSEGEAGASWLQTTYLSDRLRLGRGNKGSIFVLSRSLDDGGPLSAWPL